MPCQDVARFRLGWWTVAAGQARLPSCTQLRLAKKSASAMQPRRSHSGLRGRRQTRPWDHQPSSQAARPTGSSPAFHCRLEADLGTLKTLKGNDGNHAERALFKMSRCPRTTSPSALRLSSPRMQLDALACSWSYAWSESCSAIAAEGASGVTQFPGQARIGAAASPSKQMPTRAPSSLKSASCCCYACQRKPRATAPWCIQAARAICCCFLFRQQPATSRRARPSRRNMCGALKSHRSAASPFRGQHTGKPGCPPSARENSTAGDAAYPTLSNWLLSRHFSLRSDF